MAYEAIVCDVISLDWAYSVGDATYNAPYVAAVQLWSGDTGPGDSGYWILYGSDLADVYGATSVWVDCPGVNVSSAYVGPGASQYRFFH